MAASRVDLPALGSPTSPTSAISFSSSRNSFTSPGSPFSANLGARCVEVVKRLLPLPQVLLGQGHAQGAELGQGLAITGHFLARGLAPVLAGRGLPAARARLIELLMRAR